MPDQLHLIYSAATGRIREMYAPEFVGETNVARALRAGEAMVSFDLASVAGQDLHALQATLNAVTKLTPSNDLYALVDATGKVLAAKQCDPLCGDLLPAVYDPKGLLPGSQVVLNPIGAGPGYMYLAGAFTAPVLIQADPLPLSTGIV